MSLVPSKRRHYPYPAMGPFDDQSDDSYDDEGTFARWPGPPPDAAWRAAYCPGAVWLAARFDGCVVGTSPGGRLVYSTDAMERVLVARHGMSAEEAVDHISPLLGCLVARYPDFVD